MAHSTFSSGPGAQNIGMGAIGKQEDIKQNVKRDNNIYFRHCRVWHIHATRNRCASLTSRHTARSGAAGSRIRNGFRP
jgi:hypothetical protein